VSSPPDVDFPCHHTNKVMELIVVPAHTCCTCATKHAPSELSHTEPPGPLPPYSLYHDTDQKYTQYCNQHQDSADISDYLENFPHFPVTGASSDMESSYPTHISCGLSKTKKRFNPSNFLRFLYRLPQQIGAAGCYIGMATAHISDDNISK